jgi:hypothetical protein
MLKNDNLEFKTLMEQAVAEINLWTEEKLLDIADIDDDEIDQLILSPEERLQRELYWGLALQRTQGISRQPKEQSSEHGEGRKKARSLRLLQEEQQKKIDFSSLVDDFDGEDGGIGGVQGRGNGGDNGEEYQRFMGFGLLGFGGDESLFSETESEFQHEFSKFDRKNNGELRANFELFGSTNPKQIHSSSNTRQNMDTLHNSYNLGLGLNDTLYNTSSRNQQQNNLQNFEQNNRLNLQNLQNSDYGDDLFSPSESELSTATSNPFKRQRVLPRQPTRENRQSTANRSDRDELVRLDYEPDPFSH